MTRINIGHYAKVAWNHEIIARGKVTSIKEIPVQCISFDDRYYFPLQSKKLKISLDEPLATNINLQLVEAFGVIKWRKVSLGKLDVIYRENDIYELDPAIAKAVHTANKLKGVKTLGSCQGHGRFAYIDLGIKDFTTLIALNRVVCSDAFSKKLTLVTEVTNKPIYGEKAVIFKLRTRKAVKPKKLVILLDRFFTQVFDELITLELGHNI